MAGIRGLNELKAAFEAIKEQTIRNERSAVALGANAFMTDVKRSAPYKTGTYRRSIHVEMVQEGNRWIGLTGTDDIRAKQLEYGGIIRAKNKPYLVFKIGDQWIKTKQVVQPGHPHFRPALDQNYQRYQRIILEALFP